MKCLGSQVALIMILLSGCGGQSNSVEAPPIITPPAIVVPTVTLLAGSFGTGTYAYPTVDGTGMSAIFGFTKGLVTDKAGNVYVLDDSAVRKITPDGAVKIFAGSYTFSGDQNGPALDARFYGTISIAIDPTDNIYVTNYGLNGTKETTSTPESYRSLRKITPDGMVSTIPRTASAIEVAVDGVGNIYTTTSSLGNSIRKYSPSGEISNLAGSDQIRGTADGIGEQARFSNIKQLQVDNVGNVYAIDGNSLRKISPTGAVSTIAGKNDVSGNADGIGAAARFLNPEGLAIAKDGTIYIADSGNYLVRKVTAAGVVSTVAQVGKLQTDYATAYFDPEAIRKIAIDAQGTIYVSTRKAVLKISISTK